jgi:hypothetical protein
MHGILSSRQISPTRSASYSANSPGELDKSCMIDETFVNGGSLDPAVKHGHHVRLHHFLHRGHDRSVPVPKALLQVVHVAEVDWREHRVEKEARGIVVGEAHVLLDLLTHLSGARRLVDFVQVGWVHGQISGRAKGIAM